MQRKTMMIMSLRSLLNYNGQLFALCSKQEISKKLDRYVKLFSNECFKNSKEYISYNALQRSIKKSY